jgi:UrcA family protein
MKATHRIAAATALVAAAGVFATSAAAPSVTEVTVEVPRVVKADSSRPGSPYDVILKGHVSYADLDLSKPADAAVLEQRINDKARAICERIDTDYPDSTPNSAECAKIAAGDAMKQAHKAIAAAGKLAR